MTRFPCGGEAVTGTATYQLAHVVLNGAGVHKHSDRDQGVQGEIEDLVTEERDDPGSMLLDGGEKRMLMLIVFNITQHDFF